MNLKEKEEKKSNPGPILFLTRLVRRGYGVSNSGAAVLLLLLLLLLLLG